MNFSAWRAALRIARRDALRHKARSALVVVMIGLPILGVVTADVLFRSSQLTASEQLPRKLGDADALVTSAYGGTAVEQVPDGSVWGSPTVDSGAGPAPAEPAALTLAQVRAVLPAGSQIATWSTDGGQVHFGNAPARSVTVDELDYTSPAAGGIVIQKSGRAPHNVHEVALSEATARHLGVATGDAVTMQLSSGGPVSYLVTGIVQQRFHPDAEVAVVPPGTVLADTPPGSVYTQFLVKSPRSITWDDVQRANAVGAVVVARSVVDHPPPRSAVPYYQLAATDSMRFGIQSNRSATEVATIGVVAVMCVLEIVFLAGPAFAIGARTQRRQLGLVVASGGAPRDARHVVLGGGIVLGTAGGLIGVLLGIGTALAIRHWRITRGVDFGGLHLHALEIAGAAAVGLAVGVFAALLPARAAGTHDVVGALAGRRPPGRLRKRVSVLGLVTVAAGVALTAYGATQAPRTADVAYGSALAELGLAACVPALVTMTGGLARWLPLTPRLALRDGARNRARTASAVAAVMAAVAGSVAVGIYAASDDLAAKHNYQPLLRAGQTAVPLWKHAGSAKAGQVAAAVAAVVPVRSTALLGIPPVCVADPNADCISYQPVRPASETCPAPPQGAFSKAELLKWEADPRCAQPNSTGLFSQVVIGGPDVLSLLLGHDDPSADQVLSSGGVVVFSPLYLDSGRVTIETDKSQGDSQQTTAGTTAFDAALVSLTPAPSALLSPAAAAKIGIVPDIGGILIDSDRTTTRAQERKADRAIREFDADYSLVVERGYHGRLPTQLLLAFLGAAIVTLGAAGAATGLAIADAQPDHTTLVAVGAAPGTRRRLAMAAAGTIALMGAILGAATGFVPALGVLREHQTLLPPQFGAVAATRAGSSGFLYFGETLGDAAHGVAVSIPWPLLALVVLGLPTITALFAGAFTRSQRVVERRVG